MSPPIVYTVSIQAANREDFLSLLDAEATLIFGEADWHVSGQISVSGPMVALNQQELGMGMSGLNNEGGGDAPLKTWSVTLKSGEGPEPVIISPQEKLLQEASRRMKEDGIGL